MTAGILYLPRPRRRLAWALLPVLVLRALIPFGFMPMVDQDGVHIGFCPGEAQPPGALAHHHHGDHGTPGEGASHPPCLFAQNASPAFVSAAAPAIVPAAATTIAVDPPRRVFLPAIVRAQTPRGPPILA